MSLATLDAPMDMWHGDNFSCLALVIPRAWLDARIGGQLTRTVGLNAGHGMGRTSPTCWEACAARRTRSTDWASMPLPTGL